MRFPATGTGYRVSDERFYQYQIAARELVIDMTWTDFEGGYLVECDRIDELEKFVGETWG